MTSAEKIVLFDFDGPLVDLFARHPAARIAERLIDLLCDGYGFPRADFQGWTDPHRLVWELEVKLTQGGTDSAVAREIVRALEAELTAQEVVAAGSAKAVRGARKTVEQIRRRGWKVAITSNNSREAIEEYLRRPGMRALQRCFGGHIYGRDADPALMKPDPSCIVHARQAFESVDGSILPCVLVGDSGSDAEAAMKAGISFIGFVGGKGRRKATPERVKSLHVDNTVDVVRRQRKLRLVLKSDWTIRKM